MILAQLHATLTVLETIVPAICQAAAVEVNAQAREDMRTKRLRNIPLFKGTLKGSYDEPITTRAQGNTLTVSAIDWAMRRAVAAGKPLVWLGVVDRVASKMMREATR